MWMFKIKIKLLKINQISELNNKIKVDMLWRNKEKNIGIFV